MPTPTMPPSAPLAVDLRSLFGIAFGPAAITVLLAGLVQSLGYWHGRDVVADAGGPATLLLGTAVLLYAVFALMHALHAVGDALFAEQTPLWWLPEAVTGEDEDDGEILAVRTAPVAAFPCHLDGAVLSGGLALGCWVTLKALA